MRPVGRVVARRSHCGRRPLLQVIAAFALLSGAWIVVSDSLLAMLVEDRETLLRLGTYKGWLYIGMASVLLYLMLRRLVPLASAPLAPPALPAPRAWLWQLAGCSVLIAAVCGAAMVAAERDHRARQVADLGAMAQLQAALAGRWRAERLAQARFLARHLDGMLSRASAPGGADPLLAELTQAQDAPDTVRALLRDAAGAPLVEAGGTRVAADLQPLLAGLTASGGPRMSDPYGDGSPHDAGWQVDVAAVLPRSGAVLVLTFDARAALLPAGSEPQPGGVGVSLLRADGRPLLPLRQGAPQPAAAGAALQAPGQPALLEGDADHSLLALAHGVPDSDWVALATLELMAANAEAREDAAYIAALGTMAVLACAIGLFLLRERHALQLQQVESVQQADKLRALQLLQSIADGSTDAIFAKDRQGRYLLFNRAAAALVGRPAAEAIGRDDHALFPAVVAERMAASDRSVLATGQTLTQENELDTTDGRRILLATKSVLRNVDGAPVGVFGISRDITDLRRDARELERYRDQLEQLVQQRTAQLAASNATLATGERFLRTVTDNVPALLSYWGRDLRCRFANRQTMEYFGLGPQIIGRRITAVMGQAVYRRSRHHVRAVLQGQQRQYARTGVDASGAEVHFLVHLIPDLVDGRAQGFYVLASPVTALRTAQLQLEQSNRELIAARDAAQAASRAKDRFLANMSHEIRTPLNAIVGLADLLRAECQAPTSHVHLEQLSEAATHLLKLVNGVMDWSKLESGKLVLEQTEFDPSQVIARTLRLVAHQAQAKGIVLQCDAAGLPPLVRGDPTRLSQALLNLLGNAVKFTERGHVRLLARLAQDPAATPLLRFDIEDSGIGIAPEKHQLIFQAFEQGDASTTRRFGGTGLGLALTRSVVELMGGEVGVHSVPGVGSTFWFTACLQPCAPVPPAPTPAAAGTTGPATPPLILLVDDNELNRIVTVALLRRWGVVVEVAENGQQALDMAGARRYDLVLMDLQMPVLDGLAATRALRRIAGYETTPVLGLTANPFAETRIACLAAGMNDHIAKPVGANLLYGALARWLPAHAALPAAAGPVAGARLLGLLAGLPGLDAGRGLALVLDETIYGRLLHGFAAQYRQGVPGLDQALADRQDETARRLVHSLKGSAAALGALPLRDQAAAVEARLAAGDRSDGLLAAVAQLQRELAGFTAALRERLPEPADALPPRRSSAALTAGLQQLAALLASGDFAAQRCHDELAGALSQAFGAAAQALAEAVHQHDQRRALALLGQLTSTAPLASLGEET